MGLRRRIESIEEEDYRFVWPLSEQCHAVTDIIKRRTWERVWPPGMGPIRYAVDRDLSLLGGAKYPATDRELRILAALSQVQIEKEEVGRQFTEEQILDRVRRNLDDTEKDPASYLDDCTEYVRKLVTRMDPAKQDRREEQLYALWRELNER